MRLTLQDERGFIPVATIHVCGKRALPPPMFREMAGANRLRLSGAERGEGGEERRTTATRVAREIGLTPPTCRTPCGSTFHNNDPGVRGGLRGARRCEGPLQGAVLGLKSMCERLRNTERYALET